MSFFFRTAYLVGFKPWDSGVAAPELVAFVEREGRPAGKALDLGCGTGTNCIYLSQHGWDATGIDFVPRAVNMARKKAESSGKSARFIVGDVTRLTELKIGSDYALLFDLGCFHSIEDERRDDYVRGVAAVAGRGAMMLMFGLIRGEKPSRFGPRGLQRDEVQRRFAADWELLAAQPGGQMLGSDTAWYRLQRR